MPLIVLHDTRGRVELVVTEFFQLAREGYVEQGAGKFALHEAFEASLDTPCALNTVVVRLQAAFFEKGVQDQGEPRCCRVHGERLASKIVVGFDIWCRHQGWHDEAIRSHDGEGIGNCHGGFALAFMIRNDVVHQRNDNVGTAFCEACPLNYRAGRLGDADGQTIVRENATVLGHPDRPIERARKHHQPDGLQRRLAVNFSHFSKN